VIKALMAMSFSTKLVIESIYSTRNQEQRGDEENHVEKTREIERVTQREREREDRQIKRVLISIHMMLIASLIEPRAHHGIYESKIAA